MSSKRAQKAVGTYGFLDVLRHPSWIVRPPKPSEGLSDIEAVRAGEARSVSCFLRGTFDPFPRRLKQGSLVLSGRGVSWIPFWSFKRQALEIEVTVDGVATRPADRREPNVKKGGKAFGVVTVPAFVVVTCTTPKGALDFVVPPADEPLVADYFRSRMN